MYLVYRLFKLGSLHSLDHWAGEITQKRAYRSTRPEDVTGLRKSECLLLVPGTFEKEESER